jgi:hypothetical protein
MSGGQATSISVELDAAGVVVVVKRAQSATGSERIASECQVLELARHPGVVDLVATVDADGIAAVVTRWVGPNTLAGVRPPPLLQTAGIMAALVACVADMHDLGVIHGAITADHVILSPTGQPVLCGFGRAQVMTADTASAGAPSADDVAALGSLLRSLVGDEIDLEPIPERRGWRRRPRWQGYRRRVLQTLADQATHDEPDLRPTARALAAAIHDSVPDARLGPIAARAEVPSGVLASSTADEEGWADDFAGSSISEGDSEAERREDVPFERKLPNQGVTIGATASLRPDVAPAADRHLPPRRAAAAVIGLLGVFLALYGINDLRGSRSSAGGRQAPTALNHSPVTSTAAARPSTTQTTRAQPKATTRRTTRNCRSGSPGGVDLDADGCSDPIRVTGAVVQAAGVRYGVGRNGDRVVVADWRCDGRATPAVLRPATGEVFVFPRWAASDRQVTMHPSARVRGAAAIQAADTDHDGCSELWVQTTGRSVMVTVEPGR